MKRRQFLKSIPGIGFLLFEVQTAFADVFPNFFPPEKKSLTVYNSPTASGTEIPIVWKYDAAFVSAKELADAFNYNTYFNNEKQKLVVYFPQNKIVLSAENPFVIIDSKTLQMPLPTMWNSKQIYVPVHHLFPLVNQYTNISWDYDARGQVLRYLKERYNVAGVDIDVKKNGVVIRIRTSRKYKKGEMTIDMRYDWLHVDLYGANADTAQLSKTPVKGPVREVKPHQFDQLLSVAFRLRKEPLSKEVFQDDSSNEVVVILRYEDEIAEADIAEADEDNPDVPLEDDIQRQLEQERKRWLIDTVVIDPGHGGKDPGAIGAGGVKEKDIVLPIALKLGKLINQRMPEVKVIYTRKDDRFVELRRRTQIANENHAKAFISIHANANRSKRVNGFETYLLGPNRGAEASNVASRENAVIQFEAPGSQQHYEGINTILAGMAQSAFMRQSEHLASQVQDDIAKRLRSLKMRNRGVKQAGFWVMVGASMPSILVETGFVTNSYDARILKTSSNQQKIAEGIFNGLKRFKKDYENAI